MFERAEQHARQLFEEGADLIDVGGEATNPFGAEPLSYEEEYARVIPLIRSLPYPISIDSYKPKIVAAAIEAGAIMINDITGCSDPEMRAVVKESRLPVVVMHMQGTPQTMQRNPSYARGVVTEIREWFTRRVDTMLAEGIDPSQIILDPGIGFGKTVEHNYQILKNLDAFLSLGFPLYLSLSRKSFMHKVLGKTAQDVLPTTLALGTMTLLQGVKYLRVHDVVEHRDILTVLETMESA